jgi:hypothetical protein
VLSLHANQIRTSLNFKIKFRKHVHGNVYNVSQKYVMRDFCDPNATVRNPINFTLCVCVCVCVFYNIDKESGHICGEEPVLLIALLNVFRFCQ